MRQKRKSILITLATFFAVFGGIWTVLEPMGGFETLTKLTNMYPLFYSIMFIFAVLISMFVFQNQKLSEISNSYASITEKLDDNLNILDLSESRIKFDYAAFIETAKSEVKVIGLSLPKFATEELFDTYDALLLKGVKINIIISNPLSPSLAQRPQKLYEVNRSIRINCANTIMSLTKYKANLPINKKQLFQFRIINILPTLAIVSDGEDLLFSPYLINKTGGKSPYLKIKATSKIGQSFISHFDEIWSNCSYDVDHDLTYERLVNLVNNDKLTNFKISKSVYSNILKSRT